MRPISILLTLFLAALIGLPMPQSARAQTRVRCFEQTGYCVQDPILRYWERNGGLAVFGYPISEQRIETVEGSWSGPTQWFERDRLEDHSAEGVLAGRLGAYVLEQRGQPWTNFAQVSSAPAGCAYFAETGHSLCEPFLSYWNSRGGLARFGYPITEPFSESLEGWRGTVQYFERRRMEHHLEHRGTPYEVLLGRLGAEMLPAARLCQGQVIEELRSSFERMGAGGLGLGCPTAAYRDIPAALEHFERGQMIWLDLGRGGRKIYALILKPRPGDAGPPPFYNEHDDTWMEGQPVNGGQTAPPGLYEPQRGFGKVWRAGMGEYLGWATEPERAERATVQYFENGLLLWLHGSGNVYVLRSFPKSSVLILDRP